ncbi:MAG: bifunctional NADP-dependent methylenetetrahydromethanopterin dehydrogenase/methylenetetrahydrofolate dehydrogenase [Acidobacteria bacterium]|nr:bifunctional NADP-dependent methylenetetrahydromethanopterin dehydrogenase/methylenetetrahydrofolate dehydrogenase [Acidobacteriota bacterium]
MKKILIQLDSDKCASAFDRIVAEDAGADVVLSYGRVEPPDVRALIQGAVFTRGIPDLQNIAVWIGGSDIDKGAQLLAEVRRAFFGPFQISVMLDSNGCNTTASTAIAKLARQADLQGKSALVLGPGPVGVRAAVLLAGEGCRVRLASIPAGLLADRFDKDLAARTLASGRAAAGAFSKSASSATGGAIQVVDVAGDVEMEGLLDEAEILVCAGPAGLRVLPSDSWPARPGLKWLIDFNLVEPLGIEGIRPGDDFACHEGQYALGALAIGNPKMKVHKACIAGLFERNDLVLDTEGVYAVAKELLRS